MLNTTKRSAPPSTSRRSLLVGTAIAAGASLGAPSLLRAQTRQPVHHTPDMCAGKKKTQKRCARQSNASEPAVASGAPAHKTNKPHTTRRISHRPRLFCAETFSAGLAASR